MAGNRLEELHQLSCFIVQPRKNCCSNQLAFVVLSLCLIFASAHGQGPSGSGEPPFATIEGSPYDRINLATGAMSFTLPLRTKQGPIPYAVYLVGSTAPYVDPSAGSWLGPNEGATAWLSFQTSQSFHQAGSTALNQSNQPCNTGYGNNTGAHYVNYSGIVVADDTGAIHPTFPPSNFYVDCNGVTFPTVGSIFTTSDDSGYTLVFLGVGGSPAFDVYDKSGNKTSQGFGGAGGIVSPNGVQLLSNTYTSAGYGVTDAFNQSLGTLSVGETYDASYRGTPTTSVFSYVDGSGVTQTTSLTYSPYTFRTNFGCPIAALHEASPQPVTLPTALTLPNGRAYTLGYESTPGFPGATTQRLASISLPDGGSVSYTYSGGNNGVYCDSAWSSTNSPVRAIIPTISRTISDGQGHQSTWTYNFPDSAAGSNGSTQTTVTDPAGNDTVYQFAGGYQTKRQVYQGSSQNGSLLQTVATTYTSDNTIDGYLAIKQTDVATTYAGGSSAVLETKLNSSGLPYEVKQFDFGTLVPPTGTPIVDTTTSYGSWNGNQCVNISVFIKDRPCRITVTGGAGQLSDTLYSYDGAGNALSVSSWVSGSIYTTQSYTYYANGSVQTSTDGNGNITNYTNSACNNLLPTSITGGGVTWQQSWDCNIAAVTSVTGADNGETTSYTFADPFFRPTTTSFSDGGYVRTCYSDVGGPLCSKDSTNTEYSFGSASPNPDRTMRVIKDGLGRPTRQSSGDALTVDTTYDAVGNVQSTSNPYVSQSDSTYGIKSAIYDALGRTSTICMQDNSANNSVVCSPQNDYIQFTYNGNQTTIRDQLGFQTIKTVDALNHLSTLQEANGAITRYSNLTNGSVTGITQQGLNGESARTRSFTYDGLGRVLTAANPESGLECYGTWSGGSVGAGACGNGYDGNGNLVSKTDARGAQTVLTYDALNHVLAKTHMVNGGLSGLSSCYQYGSTSANTVPHAIGRLVAEWTQRGACPSGSGPPSTAKTQTLITAYDSMGRIRSETQCVLTGCSNHVRTQAYSYDAAGSLYTFTDGTGTMTFIKAADAAGRVSMLSRTVNSSMPSAIFQVSQYGAFGVQRAIIGSIATLTAQYDMNARSTNNTVTAGVK